jgi:hypothetical protein
VRSSSINGWVIEVWDDTRPWGSPPVAVIASSTRPTAEDRRAALQRAFPVADGAAADAAVRP